MTYDEIQTIIHLMNDRKATPEQEKEVREWADITWAYDEYEEKHMYKIIATISYGF